jgi:serine/threonine protein kinase
MLNLGDILDGKYRVLKVLGKGGMGTVYLCKNTRLDNLWSIKEVPRKGSEDVNFLAEPGILKQLSHPGIPRIVDIFEERDNLYMVMDYIEGDTLEAYVRKARGLNEDRIFDIALQLSEILSYLHGLKPPIIYRDLKPANIIITLDGRVKLIDFGISRAYKENQERDTMIMGSNGYAAPEQYGGAQSSIQTDIYGLGATLYYMAAGEAPPLVIDFNHDKNYKVKISETLGRVIERAMRFKPEERYESVKEFREEIKRVLMYQGDKTAFMEGNSNKTFAKTAYMGAKGLSGEKQKEKKKSGNRKKLALALLGFAAFIILLSSLIAFAIRGGIRNKSKEQPKPPVNKETVEDNVKKPVENVVKDINVTGVIYKDSPTVLKNPSFENEKKGKGKDKEKDEGEKSLLYTLKPQAEAGSLENKLILRIESIEASEDDVYLYLIISNKTGRDIGIYKSQTILSNSRGDSEDVESMTVIKDETLSDGTRQHKLKLRFKDMELSGASLSLKASMSLKGEVQENRELNLRIDVK